MRGNVFEIAGGFSKTSSQVPVQSSSTYPLAATVFARRVANLEALTSSPAWDEGWGNPIPASAWERLKRIAGDVISRLPDFVPTPSAEGGGTVFLRWTVPGGVDCLLEINGTRISWTTIGSRMGDRSVPLPNSDEEIVRAIVHSLC